jgi:ankyrin repeat protein
MIPSLPHVGADVNADDASELTPLHQAVLRHDARMVTLLLALGAKNEDNQRIHPHTMVLREHTPHGVPLSQVLIHQAAGSPLHLACQHQLADVVDAFLQHGGVDINVTDRGGRTPLMAALSCPNPSKGFVEHLLAEGADARWTVPTTGKDVLSILLRVRSIITLLVSGNTNDQRS